MQVSLYLTSEKYKTLSTFLSALVHSENTCVRQNRNVNRYFGFYFVDLIANALLVEKRRSWQYNELTIKYYIL